MRDTRVYRTEREAMIARSNAPSKFAIEQTENGWFVLVPVEHRRVEVEAPLHYSCSCGAGWPCPRKNGGK